MIDKLAEVREIFANHGVTLAQDDIWAVQGTPVVKHKALERLAAALEITFSKPDVLRHETDEAVLLVTGTTEKGLCEWSIGEAKVVLMQPTGRKNQWGKDEYEVPPGAMGNYQITKQAAYPYAMAEKRGKDRVILKLARIEAYSEEEADDLKAREPASEASNPAPKDVQPTRAQSAYIKKALEIIGSPNRKNSAELGDWWREESANRKDILTQEQNETLKIAVTKRCAELTANQKEPTNV